MVPSTRVSMKQGEFTLHQYWLAVLFVLVAITSRVEKAVNETVQALILAAVYESLFVLKIMQRTHLHCWFM